MFIKITGFASEFNPCPLIEQQPEFRSCFVQGELLLRDGKARAIEDFLT